MQAAVKIGAVTTLLAALLAGGVAWYVMNDIPLQARAVREYKAGHYKDALVLFKQWAAQPGVKDAPEKLRIPYAYIMDIEARLNPVDPGQLNAKPPTPAATATADAVNSATPAPIPGKPDGQPGSSAAEILALAQAQAAAEAANAGIVTMANRIPHKPVPSGEVLTTTIKNLGNFPFDPEKDTTVPNDVLALDGAKIRVNGFMLPLTQAEKITKFALIPSLVGCCFGQPPGVEHIITAYVPSDHAADYSVDEIVVEGTLHVRIQRAEGYTNSIFEMDVTSVQPKE